MKRHLSLIVLTAITVAYICPIAISSRQSSTSGEKASMSADTEIEIQRLTVEKARRKRTAAIWDGLNIAFICVAGIAAVGLVVTSIRVSRSNEALTEISEELSHLKDLKAEGEIAATSKLANDAGERAGKVEIEAGKQRERAAKAESDLLELKKSLAPRRLTAEQKAKLTALLKPFAGTSMDVEWADAGGPEAADLASDILDAVQRAAINIKTKNILMGLYFRKILMKYGANRMAEANVIATFFIEVGLSEEPVPGQLLEADPNQLAIAVGIKP
jgi:hypothetical protein